MFLNMFYKYWFYDVLYVVSCLGILYESADYKYLNKDIIRLGGTQSKGRGMRKKGNSSKIRLDATVLRFAFRLHSKMEVAEGIGAACIG